MSVKVLGVKGQKLAGHTADTQDWVFDVGKQFLASGRKEFLQAFKPNAEIASKLSDSVKGAVSTVARATNTVLNAVGANSKKLAFYGHPVVHPAGEEYFSQVAYRYGEYVAKLGFFPSSPGLKALKEQPFDPETPDALRDAMNAFFKENPAEFELRVQFNTGLDDVPIEDAQAKWPETDSQYQIVARLVIPVQTAWDPAKDGYFEDLTFSPAHGLAAHRPWAGSTVLVLSPTRLSRTGVSPIMTRKPKCRPTSKRSRRRRKAYLAMSDLFGSVAFSTILLLTKGTLHVFT